MTWVLYISRDARRRLAAVGAIFLFLLFSSLFFFRITQPRDVVAYIGMATDCHPVWQHLAFHRLKKGDDVRDFLRRFPPSGTKQHGEEATYAYYLPHDANGLSFSGVTIVAENGRALSASAWSCTWLHTFFA